MNLNKPNSVKTPPNFMRFAATGTFKQYLPNPVTDIPPKVCPLENFKEKTTTLDEAVPDNSTTSSK